jgi:7,8-dihydroneopterin 2',3'-cyclic phosphate phosphodiesterase
MMSEISAYIEMIGDDELRGLVEEFMNDPSISLDGEMLAFEDCPGGSYVHHSYGGGLLQHTVAVVRMALTLSDLVEQVYAGEVDRDVVLAGAILHDVMKCYVYAPGAQGGFVSSPLGERIDHLSLLVAEMYRRGFPADVIHVAASHHGDQSPIKPKTVEALIVSVADFADAEMSRSVLRAAEYLLRAAGEEPRLLSSREAFQIVKAKARGGLDGVRRARRGES